MSHGHDHSLLRAAMAVGAVRIAPKALTAFPMTTSRDTVTVPTPAVSAIPPAVAAGPRRVQASTVATWCRMARKRTYEVR